MNRYRLVHVTEFHYDGPVSESYNEVRLRPRHDERQSCLSFRLNTLPSVPAVAHRDYYDNWVHQFNVLSEHRYLRVEAESVVMIHETPAPATGMTLAAFDALAAGLQEEHFEHLAATNYVPHLSGLQDLIEQSEQTGDGTCHAFVQAASDLVHRSFRYEQGATHVHSSIEDALQSRAGVCQDFAHMLLAILRMRGFPARYVSGYLVPRRALDARAAAGIEDVIGGQASHAWTEVLLPEAGWIGLDPTLGAPVAAHHVRIAYGRDYGDIPPVRGVYRGHAGQRLSVDVRVRPALDGEGREHLQEISSGHEPPPAGSDHQPQQQQ